MNSTEQRDPTLERSLELRGSPDITLSIDHLWGGAPLDHTHAQVGLTLTPTALLVQVSARWMRDAPPPGPPGPLWGLWAYEVVELFVVGAHERYLELELSPHGHHLALSLEGVREPVRWALPLEVDVRRGERTWEASLSLPRALLPSPQAQKKCAKSPQKVSARYQLNAFACWGQGKDRRFALSSPLGEGSPDFHRVHLFPSYALSERFHTEQGADLL